MLWLVWSGALTMTEQPTKLGVAMVSKASKNQIKHFDLPPRWDIPCGLLVVPILLADVVY